MGDLGGPLGSLKGRLALAEIMTMDDRIKALVLERASASAVSDAARSAGMETLREAAIRKLAECETTFEEVVRVTADAT